MAATRFDCTICPRKPKFSDLSHLLTHLASKGHLSHYFKAQVRSREEPQIQTQLEHFDRWYSDNDMDKLLHERLVQKDKKRNGNRAAQQSEAVHDARIHSSRFSRSFQQPISPSGSLQSQNGLIDPQLTRRTRPVGSPARGSHRRQVKQEEDDAIQNGDTHDTLDSTLGDAPPPYPTAGSIGRSKILHCNFRQTQGLQLAQRASAPPSGSASGLSQVRTFRRGVSDGSVVDYNNNKTLHSINGSEHDEEVEMNEYVTLKGTIWPGMDLFDSASLHAKRIRNQKKDVSCLEQMRTYAETIEPNEDIYFYPSWELKKSREITGQVESSSPEKKEPNPGLVNHRGRSKRTRNRVPLASLDVNVPPPKRRAAKTGSPTLHEEIQRDEPWDLAASFPSIDHYYPFSNSWQSHDDDDPDWSSTFGHIGNRKQGLAVFRDNEKLACPSIPRGDENEPVLNTSCPRPQLSQPRAPRSTLLQQPEQLSIQPETSHSSRDFPAQPGTSGSRFDYDKENHNPVFSTASSLYDYRSHGTDYHDAYPQRYFSMTSTTDLPQFSATMPPFMDFLMGYQERSIVSPGSAFNNYVATGNHQGIQQRQQNVLQSPLRQSQSSSSLNPLLDFAGLLNTSASAQESDNETIDDGIGEGTEPFVRAG